MPATRPSRTSVVVVAAVVVFTLLPASLAPGPVAAGDGPPRYDLPVGRVLTYAQQSHSKRLDGTPGDGTRATTRATVVAANPDGSRRVIVRAATTYGDQPQNVQVGAFDAFPDGRTQPAGRANPHVAVRTIFPLLPPDAAATTWTAPTDWNGTVTTYTAAAASPAAGGAGDEFAFTSADDGTVSRIYEVTNTSTVHFDRRHGVVLRAESEATQRYVIKETVTGQMTLEKDEQIDPARAAALAAAYAKFFHAEATYADQMARLYEEPADAARVVADARAVLVAARDELGGEAEVLRELDERIARHDRYAENSVEDAKHIANILNKPAADWQATDLDGRPWGRDALKGKVVVMDFWYRGCGWCMFAMPQVKQLAADYRDRGVVVLGMNTDRKEEDARFVVKALELSYPQIKAQDLPERFGVQGFPTLLVIDQTGTVRAVHVGYAPDLRERVGRRIDQLLQERQQRPGRADGESPPPHGTPSAGIPHSGQRAGLPRKS